MEIIRSAVAGTLESSDVMIQVEPDDETLQIEIESVVKQQFYQEIKHVIEETLAQLAVSKGRIYVNDKGALNCVIAARMETALRRGGEV